MGYLSQVPLIPVVSFGIVTISQYVKQNAQCTKQSVMHWDTSGPQLLNQIMMFTRNNLIAAGAI